MATMDKNGNMAYQPEELTPPDSVDYFIYRTDVAREHKHAKQWMIAFFVMLALAVGTNWYWIWYDHQFKDVEITQENTDGYNNFIGNDGDIYNGEADNQNEGTQDGR